MKPITKTEFFKRIAEQFGPKYSLDDASADIRSKLAAEFEEEFPLPKESRPFTSKPGAGKVEKTPGD